MKIYGGDVDPFVASVTHKHSGIKVWNFLIPEIAIVASILDLDLSVFKSPDFLYNVNILLQLSLL